MSTPTHTALLCDRCGESCADGYETRYYGTESDTGYQDSEVVCARCIAEEGDEVRWQAKVDCDWCGEDCTGSGLTFGGLPMCDECYREAMRYEAKYDDTGRDNA